MIVDPRFIFILNPKAASLSIGTAFSKLGYPLTRSHAFPDEKPDQPVVAAVWREDEDRLKSAYRFVKCNVGFEKWKAGEGRPFYVFGNTDIRNLPQSRWFEHVTMKLRFEQIAEDWARFLRVVGLPHVDLPHINKSETTECL